MADESPKKYEKIEKYLSEYHDAMRDLRRLQKELIAATRAYKDGVSLFPGHDFTAMKAKNKPITDPTARAALLLADTLGADVERIEHAIIGQRAIIAAITALVNAAGLTWLEREYVRLRYWEGRSAANTMMRMEQAERTYYRIRQSALDKLEKKSGT